MSYANAKTLALKLKQFKQLLNAPAKKRYNLVANVVVQDRTECNLVRDMCGFLVLVQTTDAG